LPSEASGFSAVATTVCTTAEDSDALQSGSSSTEQYAQGRETSKRALVTLISDYMVATGNSSSPHYNILSKCPHSLVKAAQHALNITECKKKGYQCEINCIELLQWEQMAAR
jgi:hypothetical protein